MVNDLKSLKQLLALCRKAGVTEITMDGMNIKFGDEPIQYAPAKAETEEEPILNPDDLIFYSSPSGDI